MGFPSTAMLIAVLRAASLFLLQGIQIPAPTGLVNDFAHVIEPEAAQHMERIAEDVRTKSRGEIAIVTLPDIGTRDVQEVALQIGRQWKVGKIGNPGDPTRNAGAVILLVPKETSKDGRGHCFIATGYGAEGFITDADAGDICREATPDFRAQDYSTGLELVTLRTAERFARSSTSRSTRRSCRRRWRSRRTTIPRAAVAAFLRSCGSSSSSSCCRS